MKTLSIFAILALIAPAGFALANPGDNYRPDEPGRPEEPGTFPGMPDAAKFGLCTAWQANETGRENGAPDAAAPFVWLQEEAEENDQTVEEYCENVQPGLP